MTGTQAAFEPNDFDKKRINALTDELRNLRDFGHIYDELFNMAKVAGLSQYTGTELSSRLALSELANEADKMMGIFVDMLRIYTNSVPGLPAEQRKQILKEHLMSEEEVEGIFGMPSSALPQNKRASLQLEQAVSFAAEVFYDYAAARMFPGDKPFAQRERTKFALALAAGETEIDLFAAPDLIAACFAMRELNSLYDNHILSLRQQQPSLPKPNYALSATIH